MTKSNLRTYLLNNSFIGELSIIVAGFSLMAFVAWFSNGSHTYDEYVRICTYNHSDVSGYNNCMSPYWQSYNWFQVSFYVTLTIAIMAGILLIIKIVSKFYLSRRS